MLAKSSCVLCICRDDNDDDHGVRRANTARALARWRRLGAYEAIDTLHRAMCLALYCPVGMIIGFVFDYVTFYYIVNSRVAIN